MKPLLPLALLAAATAVAAPPDAFETLLQTRCLMGPEEAVAVLGETKPLSRAASRAYRDRAAACFGKEPTGGTFEWNAPTLAHHPLGRAHPEGLPPDPGPEAAETKPARHDRKKAEAEAYLMTGKVRVLVQLPEGYDPDKQYPLIVWLHGSWTNFEKGSGALRKGMKDLPVILASVDSSRAKIDGAGWNLFPEIGSVLTVLRQMRLRYAVDGTRIQIWGHSNGAGGSLKTASFYPGRFAGAASFSCVLQEGMDPAALQTDNLRGIPLHIWQGEKDANPTSLAARGRAFSAWLKTLGLDASYEEEAGEDHMPNPESVKRAWDRLGKATLPANPRTASLKGQASGSARGSGKYPPDLRQAMAGRCHWLEASGVTLAPEGGSFPYALSGRIEGQRILLETSGVTAVRLYLNDALLDLDQEVTVSVDGTERFKGRLARSLGTLTADLLETASPEDAADAILEIALERISLPDYPPDNAPTR